MGGKHQEYLYFFFARNLAIETGKQHQTSNTNLKTSLIPKHKRIANLSQNIEPSKELQN